MRRGLFHPAHAPMLLAHTLKPLAGLTPRAAHRQGGIERLAARHVKTTTHKNGVSNKPHRQNVHRRVKIVRDEHPWKLAKDKITQYALCQDPAGMVMTIRDSSQGISQRYTKRAAQGDASGLWALVGCVRICVGTMHTHVAYSARAAAAARQAQRGGGFARFAEENGVAGGTCCK